MKLVFENSQTFFSGYRVSEIFDYNSLQNVNNMLHFESYGEKEIQTTPSSDSLFCGDDCELGGSA